MSNKLVHIIDVESGNLRSLQNAIEHLDYSVKFIKTSSDFKISEIETLFLPGVGNYGHFVKQIIDRGFAPVIEQYIKSGKPLMGICVGLQAFFRDSEETPNFKGLDYIPLGLRKFNKNDPTVPGGKSIPHIGWNTVNNLGPNEEIYGINSFLKYYFVHSYAALTTSGEKKLLESKGWTLLTSKYGSEEFVAAILKDNIFATQFHPEKSGTAGLKVIKAFLTQTRKSVFQPSELDLQQSLNTEKSVTGLTRRVIACLDVRTNDVGDLVVTKGDQYDVREKSGNSNDVRNLGKPVELAEKYYKQGADEVTFLNITSFRNSPVKDAPMLEVLKLAAKTVFVPLTVGGGIKDVVDPDGTLIPALQVATLYFRSGADKVSIGTDAVVAAEKYYANGEKGDGTSPMETISKAYGVQAVVISVDPKRFYVSDPSETKMRTIKTKFAGPNGEQYCYYKVTSQGGRKVHELGAAELCIACEQLGAGEILLNCIDKDGSNSGYDLELIDQIKSHVDIPVIASSGAGNPQHFEEVFTSTKTDAALGAGMFHRGEYTVAQVKQYLREKGLNVRIDQEDL